MNKATSKILTQAPAQIAAGQFESNFAARCWTCGARADGRGFLDPRLFTFTFDGDRGQCVVSLGKTAVMATVTASLGAPSSFSPRAGFFEIATRVVPVESKTDPRVLQQLLDRLYRNPAAPALDVAGLCVVPGAVVWNVQVVVVVLADTGNVLDAATWACTAALAHFRRDEVAVTGDGTVRRYPAHERDPVPLALLHMPISLTFLILPPDATSADINTTMANNNNNNQAAAARFLCVDPTSVEEQSKNVTTITVGCNSDGQVFFCHGGPSVAGGFSYEDARRARQQAKALAPPIVESMKSAMLEDQKLRKKQALAKFEWAQERVGIRARVDESASSSTNKK